MAKYNKTEWKTDDIITVEKLNNIETGLTNLDERVGHVEQVTSSMLQYFNGTPLLAKRSSSGSTYSTSKTLVQKSVSWLWDDTNTTHTLTIGGDTNPYKINRTLKEQEAMRKINSTKLSNLGFKFNSYRDTDEVQTEQMQIKVIMTMNGNSNEYIQTYSFKKGESLQNGLVYPFKLDDDLRKEIISLSYPKLTFTFQIITPGIDSQQHYHFFNNVSIYNEYVSFYSFNEKGELVD